MTLRFIHTNNQQVLIHPSIQYQYWPLWIPPAITVTNKQITFFDPDDWMVLDQSNKTTALSTTIFCFSLPKHRLSIAPSTIYLSCWWNSSTFLEMVQVGWVKADTKAIQAIDFKVVTHNSRVSVERSPGSSVWKLLIKNVKQEDAGAYMCQINTDPMQSQVPLLFITPPPCFILIN